MRIQDLLSERTLQLSKGCLLIYTPGGMTTPLKLPYATLRQRALHCARSIRRLDAFRTGAIIVLHIHDHYNTLLWFWAALLANCTPLLSTPFSNLEEHRASQIATLSKLVGPCICITTTSHAASFHDATSTPRTLQIHTIESLIDPEPYGRAYNWPCQALQTKDSDTCMMMMTSGSSGTPKIVSLSHKQIFAAIAGKSSVRKLSRGKAFLNWIGLEHVASLVEIHLQALWLQVDQIHVSPIDIIASPWTLLQLLSRHQVTRSFAPNFLLAKLASSKGPHGLDDADWDLTHLSSLASGGEANDIDVCIAASRILSSYGAREHAIVPGFGMTETCAGAIFNVRCPTYDVAEGLQFASVGSCMDGIQMRINKVADLSDTPVLAEPQESGNLEVRGDVVFQGYFGNDEATKASFTTDGWFRTGDEGLLDANGHLRLLGRLTDVLNINGVKYDPTQIETAIERALGASIARCVCFAARHKGAIMDRICIAYSLPCYDSCPEDSVGIPKTIKKIVLLYTSTVPTVFCTDNATQLPESALGKISRSRMRKHFEQGFFENAVRSLSSNSQSGVFAASLTTLGVKVVQRYSSKLERSIAEEMGRSFGLEAAAVGPDASIMDLGISSMELLNYKLRLEKNLQLRVSLTVLITHTTPERLATALQEQSRGARSPPYNPVITLRADGQKGPLWLVHPGVGEVLVFLGLAQHMKSRPMYALRARGFEHEESFTSIEEIVKVYYAAIKKTQPKGPYAIVGYSYGAMLAFELSKFMMDRNNHVYFFGSLNLPPHIKLRMRQLDWNSCLVHLAFFLNLVTEDSIDEREANFQGLSRPDAMNAVLSIADVARMKELGLDAPKLHNWTNIAFALQSMARTYEPSGQVESVDVFHAEPLKHVARSREDWVDNHLSRWADFSATPPRVHAVGGSHYTMLSATYVESFAQVLEAALLARDPFS